MGNVGPINFMWIIKYFSNQSTMYYLVIQVD